MTELQVMMGVGFAAFLGLMAYLGWLGYKRTANIKDFAIAGAGMGPVVLGLAFAATFFSAATFVGYTGWAYGWGFSGLWIILTLVIASPLGLIVVAKRAREANTSQGSLSLPDWLGDRFGSNFVRIVVAIACLANIFVIAAQFSAGALVFEQLMDLPYLLGLALIAVIVVAYTVGGGSYADIYTDAVQAVLMAVSGVLIFVSGFWVFNQGLTGIMTDVDAELAQQGEHMTAIVNPESGIFYSLPAIMGAFIIQFAFSSQPQLFNKVLALKEPRDMGVMILTYIISAVCFLAVVFGGYYAVMTSPGLEVADQAIFAYALEAFPAVIVALFGVTVMAAAMSTTDGIFVVISTAVANDIYRKVLVPKGIIRTAADKVEARTLQISRVVTVLTAVAAVALVVDPPDFIGSYIWIGFGGVASATMGPLLVSLMAPGLASKRAAQISSLGGFAAYIAIFILEVSASTMANGALGVLISVALMVIFGLIYKDKDVVPLRGGAPGVPASTPATEEA